MSCSPPSQTVRFILQLCQVKFLDTFVEHFTKGSSGIGPNWASRMLVVIHKPNDLSQLNNESIIQSHGLINVVGALIFLRGL